MLLIVNHHYVVNSGIMEHILKNPFANNSIFMTIWGLWGKTGINCFVMITGWFMCKSRISILKFIKLILEVEFYLLTFKLIFVITGFETISFNSLREILPISSVADDFIGSFILFFLFIPFLNILINHLSKRQHAWLTVLLLGIYTILGSSIIVPVRFNYITWFTVLYIVISYIRFYGFPIELKKRWGILTIICISLSILSVFFIEYVGLKIGKVLPSWGFVSDSNKILALSTALCSFMWVKGIKIKYNKFINAIASSTFAVLLIHANSNAMRHWLWHDTLQNAEMFYTQHYVLHAIVSCFTIFIISIAIDRFRIIFLERPLLRKIEGKYGKQFSHIENNIFPKDNPTINFGISKNKNG